MSTPQENAGSFAKNGTIAAIALALGLVCDYFFHDDAIGISFPIYVILGVSGLFAALQLNGRKPTWSEYWLVLPLIGFAGMVAVRANEMLTFINVVATFGLSVMLVSVAAGRRVRDHDLVQYAKVLIGSLRFFPEAVKSASELGSYGKEHARKSQVSQVVKGLIIAIPFLLIFGALFASADLAFGKSLQGLLPSFSLTEAWRTLFLVAFSSMFLLGAYRFACKGGYLKENAGAAKAKQDQNLVVITFLTLVNALFLAFIVFQLRYLFGGAANIERLGFTYAEYARQGFFQLVAATALSFAMLLGLEHVLADKEKPHSRAFKALSALHVLLIGGIIFSAHQRMTLYESAYGFTEDRFFAHAFVFLLGVMFLALIRKIVADRAGNELAFHMLIAVIAFCVCVNVINPDAFVAARNMERYRQTGKIDAEYLGHLSADAIPTTADLLKSPDADIAAKYADALIKRFHHTDLERGPWFTYHFAKSQAAAVLHAQSFNVDEAIKE